MPTDAALNDKVQALLQDQIARGTQLGTQVAAYRHGQQLVHTWAGLADIRDTRPVDAKTLFSSFSTTKGVAACAVHILADRGLLEYDAPVAKYWPEFAQNGKAKITVAQAMSHQAGLHRVPRPLTVDFATDWEAGLRWIEELAPAYEPGTKTGYHAVSYAWLAGGIVTKVSGKHIRDFVIEDIARPLGVDGEIYIGIPDDFDERHLSRLRAAGGGGPRAGLAATPTLAEDHPMFDAMPPDSEVNYNDIRIRRASLAGSNGHFTANGLAKMYGALANCGEVEGVHLVSAARIPSMQKILTTAKDEVTAMPMRKGIGFMMGGLTDGVHGPTGPRETAFGHAGNGGSIAFADPELGLSIAVTLNLMQPGGSPNSPALEICDLIRTELTAGVAK